MIVTNFGPLGDGVRVEGPRFELAHITYPKGPST